MKIIYTTLFSFFFLSIFAQCVDIEDLNSIDSVAAKNRQYFQTQFINKDTGWVIDGGSHKILYTNDGAKTWTIQSKDNLITFLGCYFLNTQVGWISGWTSNGGKVLRTIDGGKNWLDSETKFPNNLALHNVYFMDKDTGWALGNSVILKSTDGGKNWIEKLHFPQPSPAYITTLVYLQFINTKIAYACGGIGLVYKTTDGGETWTKIPDPNPKALNMLHIIYGMSFKNPLEGWAYGEDVFHKTNDGGQTWLPFTDVSPSPIFDGETFSTQDITFTDSLNAWATTFTHYFYNSKDGGKTWTSVKGSKPFDAYDVQFIDKNTAYIISSSDMYRAHFNKPPRCQSVQLIQQDPSEPLELKPTLTWHPAPACVDGYRILIGTTPYSAELYNLSIFGIDTTHTVSVALPQDKKLYVTIRPFNTYGVAYDDCTSFPIQTKKVIATDDLEKEKDGLRVKVIPNPFNDQVKLSIKSNQSTDEAVQVTISDIMGRTIYQTYTSLQKGYNEVIVENTSAWATGIYTYTIRSATDVASALFVKQ
jgi:photosystem II stability/assembly factor-like uncharacterized protein